MKTKILNEFRKEDRRDLHEIEDQFTIAYEIELESRDPIGEPDDDDYSNIMSSDQIFEVLADSYEMDSYIEDIYEYIRERYYDHDSADVDVYAQKLQIIIAYDSKDYDFKKRLEEAYKVYMNWKNNSVAVNFLRSLVEEFPAEELVGILSLDYPIYEEGGVGFIQKGNLSFDFEKGLKKAEDYGPEDVAEGIKPLEENYTNLLHRLWSLFILDFEFAEFVSRDDELEEVYVTEEQPPYTSLKAMGFEDLAYDIESFSNKALIEIQECTDTYNSFDPDYYSQGSEILLDLTKGIQDGFEGSVRELAEMEEMDNPDGWLIDSDRRDGEDPKSVLHGYLPRFMNKWQDDLKFEEDGSLRNGVEFSPQTYLDGLEAAQTFLTDFFDEFKKQQNFNFSSRTGLHINVGIADYDGSFNLMKGLLFLSEPRTKTIDPDKKYYAYAGADSRLYSQWATAVSPKVKELIVKELSLDDTHSTLRKRFQQLTLNNDTVQEALTSIIIKAGRENGIKSTGFNIAHVRNYHYIEFRYPGHEMGRDEIYNLTEYYCYVVKLMTDPEYKKKEYMKKLIGYLSSAESEANAGNAKSANIIKKIPRGKILSLPSRRGNSSSGGQIVWLDSFKKLYEEYVVWLNKEEDQGAEVEAVNFINDFLPERSGSTAKQIRFGKLVRSKNKTSVQFESFSLGEGYKKEECSVELFLAMFRDPRDLEDATMSKPSGKEFFPVNYSLNKEMGGFLSAFKNAYENLFTSEDANVPGQVYLPQSKEASLLKLVDQLKKYIQKTTPHREDRLPVDVLDFKEFIAAHPRRYHRVILKDLSSRFSKLSIDEKVWTLLRRNIIVELD